MGIKIIAEATSNLFKNVLLKNNADIKVMNMHLVIGDKEYNCYDDEMDISDFSKYFFQKIAEGEKTRTTLVSPGEFEEEFKKEIAKGNKVICFTMASGISGTHQSACIARDLVNEEAKEEMVYVVDSMTAGFGEGLQALHADKLVKEGKNFEEIKVEVEKYKYFVRSEFTVDEIKYLLKTGRASKALAKFLSLANVKVLLKNSTASKIVFAGPAFGRKNAIKKLGEQVNEKVDRNIDQIIYITHCDIYDDALKLKELIAKSGFPEDKIEIYDYDLISGAHIGPKALAVFYVSEESYEK